MVPITYCIVSTGQSETVTNAFVVPTMLARIVDAMEKGLSANTESLRAIAYGGGKMPLEVIHKALERFPSAGFTNAYGLTETSSTVALLGPALSAERSRPKASPTLQCGCHQKSNLLVSLLLMMGSL